MLVRRGVREHHEVVVTPGFRGGHAEGFHGGLTGRGKLPVGPVELELRAEVLDALGRAELRPDPPEPRVGKGLPLDTLDVLGGHLLLVVNQGHSGVETVHDVPADGVPHGDRPVLERGLE